MNRRNVVMICVLALAPTAFPNVSQDGSWYAQQVAKAEEQYRKEDKSPLHYFLGTEFGCYQLPYAYWMRLKERFGPFGWIRTMRNGGSKRFKADAELTYHLMNGPSNLVNVAKGVAELFRGRFGVEMQETQQSSVSNCVWSAEGKSPPYDVCVKVCGPFEVNSANGEWRAYALQFEVANRWLGENPKATYFNPMRRKETWAEVFAPIRIDPERESIQDAWLYAPPNEPTTEERLERAIKERKPSLVPRYAGIPGGITKDGVEMKYTGCTEQEADFFSPDSNMFFRYCSVEEQNRMRDLAATPHRMRPRAPGEKRQHFAGNIDGEVFPGDVVKWNSENGDWLTGVAVSQEEDGEYVDTFKCKVRITERVLHAQKEDYLPSPASSNYQAHAKELQERLKQWRDSDSKLWQAVDRYDEKEAAQARKESFMRKSRRLAMLRAELLPGVYANRLYNIIEMPTKEAAARAVKRREMQDLSRWQNLVGRAIYDILLDLGTSYRLRMETQDGLLTEAECRELDLSAYERSMIENGREWEQFSIDSGNMHIHGVRPPHVPMFSHGGVWDGWNPDAYSKRTEKYYEAESSDFKNAFTAYVGFCTNTDAFVDAKIIDSFAQNVATNMGPQPRVWLIRQLCLAHGVRHLSPWRLLVEVGAILANGMPKNEKPSDNEIAWFRNAVKSQYFKGQINRLADDAFRTWLRGRMAKLLGRKITEADFEYVCTDDVLLKRRDYKIRKPYDGGDVLPHPFTFFGCTFGKAYSQAKTSGKNKSGDIILSWNVGFPIEHPYFGKKWMTARVSPRSKIAYSGKIYWHGLNTRKELLALAKDVRADIEKRLGVKLGDFFFESGQHICDEATWWKADGVAALSRSVFGPIRIEIEAIDDSLRISPGGRLLKLAITDTETESLVEKERKENPLKYDREAEMRQHKERYQRYKAREQEKNKPATQQPTTR